MNVSSCRISVAPPKIDDDGERQPVHRRDLAAPVEPRDLRDRGRDRDGGRDVDALPLERDEKEDEREIVREKLHKQSIIPRNAGAAPGTPRGGRRPGRRTRPAGAPHLPPAPGLIRRSSAPRSGQTGKPRPVERRARIGLAPGRDVAVADDIADRVAAPQRLDERARASRTARRRTACRRCLRARCRPRSRCSARGPSSAMRRRATRASRRARTGSARRRGE